ncbi:MAG: hemolysin family protein [Lachnospiraceae bacterium]
MIGSYWQGYLVIMVLSVFINSIFNHFDKAVKEMNEKQLEKKSDKENEDSSEKMDLKTERLRKFMETPRLYRNSMRLMSVCFAVAIGVVGALHFQYAVAYVQERELEGWSCWGVLVGVWAIVLAVLLICQALGTTMPRKLASLNPEKSAYRYVNQVYYLRMISLPVSLIVDGIAWIGLRCMGINLFEKYEKVSEEEIISVVNEGHEQGVLEAEEAEMIHNIIEVSDKEAGDIMTHRSNIVALDGTTTLEETVSTILHENYSRFPVYHEDFDDIVGILHVRDAFIFMEVAENKDKPIEEIEGLLREPSFIPETRKLMPLLQEMQEQKAHLEIVIDEYGQVAGVLSMEDILEEIVGNILDEYDEEEDGIMETAVGVYEVDGMSKLKELGEQLDVDFSEVEQETLNGLLMSLLPRIPKVDEHPEVVFDGYLFQVTSMKGRVIGNVHIEKLPELSEEPQNETFVEK